jgi:hypothetical protein
MTHVIFVTTVCLLAFSPAIISFLGYVCLGMPKNLNESNSSLMALPWFLLITLPVGGIVLTIYGLAQLISFFFL